MKRDKQDFTLSIFAGDNIFSYLLISQVLNTFKIERIYISKHNKSIKNIGNIFKKTSFQYFIYRSFIQFLSIFFNSLSIAKYAKKNNIEIIYLSNKNEFKKYSAIRTDLSLTANFDLIIPSDYIESLKHGIINTHASNLPKDRGISPVVWSYCRGDKEIYISFYKMDGGIDTGPLIKKEKINISKSWSLFRTYCEVLLLSSFELSKLINNKVFKRQHNQLNDEKSKGSYNSWPDKELNKKMRFNKRRYFRLSDIIFLNKISKDYEKKSLDS